MRMRWMVVVIALFREAKNRASKLEMFFRALVNLGGSYRLHAPIEKEAKIEITGGLGCNRISANSNGSLFIRNER